MHRLEAALLSKTQQDYPVPSTTTEAGGLDSPETSTSPSHTPSHSLFQAGGLHHGTTVPANPSRVTERPIETFTTARIEGSMTV